MATQAFVGQGTIFQISNLASGSVDSDYVSVAECRITNFTNRAQRLDATNHDTTGSYGEYLPGTKEFIANFGGNFLPHTTSHQRIQTIYDSNAQRQMRFRLPQTTPNIQITFTGTIGEFSASFNTNEVGSFTAQAFGQGGPTFSTWS